MTDLRNAIQKRAADVAPEPTVTKPRWLGEMGAPPRGQTHAVVRYEGGRARGACGTLFRLDGNMWMEKGDPWGRYDCPRCIAKIESGAVEDRRQGTSTAIPSAEVFD